jgi:hypothetical protein
MHIFGRGDPKFYAGGPTLLAAILQGPHPRLALAAMDDEKMMQQQLEQVGGNLTAPAFTLSTYSRSKKASTQHVDSLVADTQKRQRRSSERQGGQPDGRSCDMCGEKDTSDDPVDKALTGESIFRSWGYPANADGSQQGTTCLYCLLCYVARFKHKGKSKNAAVTEIGNNHEQHTKFKACVSCVIEFFISRGGRHMVIGWADIDRRVIVVITQKKIEIFEADDDLWDYDLYVREHGDPESNGKGHKVVCDYGKKDTWHSERRRHCVCRRRPRLGYSHCRRRPRNHQLLLLAHTPKVTV